MRFTFLFIRFRLYEIEVKVFSDFPEALAFIKVFIIKSPHFVGCWGRRLVSESLCIMVQIHLEWSRIPAWGAGGPGFKSQRPHHIPTGPIWASENKQRFPTYSLFFSVLRARPGQDQPDLFSGEISVVVEHIEMFRELHIQWDFARN
jgi:hypothetical protein